MLVERDVRPDDGSIAVVERVGPDAVSSHVSARLARLPVAGRRLAEAVAVLGPRAAIAVAGELAGLTAADLAGAVDMLVRADLVETDGGVSFRHPLLAAAVYQSLPPHARERAHERAATLLTSAHEPAERVAAHYLNIAPAGVADRALVLVAAAMEARRRGAPDSAATYLHRARAEPPPDPFRSEVVRQLGNCEAYVLDWDGAERHLHEATELAVSPEHRALAWFSLARYCEVTQRHEAAARTLQTALAKQPPDVAAHLRIRLQAELAGYCTVVIGRREQRRDVLCQLRGDPVASWAPLANVLLAHEAFDALGSGADAARVGDLAEHAVAGGMLAPDLSALYVALLCLAAAGRYGEAIVYLRRAAQWAQVRGLIAAESLGRAYTAMSALWRGDLAEAQAELTRGWELSGGGDHSVPALLGAQIEVNLERGDLAAAAVLLERHPITLDVASTSHGLRALFGRGRYLLASRQFEAAIDTFEQLGRLHDQWGMTPLLDAAWRSGAARACLALGRNRRARLLAADELELARSFGAPRPLGVALQTKVLLGDDDAVDAAREAVDVLAQSPARLEYAWALSLLGRLLLDRRQRRSAREYLTLSAELATQCGADLLLRTVDDQLKSAGGRPAAPRVTGVGALTPAERRVAVLAAKDKNNREIARELYVTEKTIEFHVTGILRKLGARSRRELTSKLDELAEYERVIA